MFIGATGGIALSKLPGLPLIADTAMGIEAMTVSMLGLPLTSVLLASLYLETDAIALMALVVVAVVVAYDTTARLHPFLPAAPARQPADTAPAAT
jgi:chloride channel protein, CIC family